MSKIQSEALVRALVEGWVKGRLEIVSFERSLKEDEVREALTG